MARWHDLVELIISLPHGSQRASATAAHSVLVVGHRAGAVRVDISPPRQGYRAFLQRRLMARAAPAFGGHAQYLKHPMVIANPDTSPQDSAPRARRVGS